MPVRAITFDFWRTLFCDDGKSDHNRDRHQLRIEALCKATGVDESRAKAVLKVVQREFLRVHIEEQRTLVPSDAIPLAAEALGVSISAEAGKEVAHVFGTAILDHPPLAIEGALEAVRAAAECVDVGLISDTGMSPGASLEVILERHGIRDCFKVLTFSDLVGVAKPQAAMFEHAAGALGVAPDELLHIGDLEPTDIRGALDFGAQAALFAGDNKRFEGATEAHHTFTSWTQFVEVLPSLI